MNSQPEFYVGYLPIPSALKTSMRRVTCALAILALAVGIALVLAQAPFAASTFEFGDNRDFEGTLITKPFQALLVPGDDAWLLVAPGKHGFEPPERFDGRVVRLRGQRIYRKNDRMIEVAPGSVSSQGAAGVLPSEIDLGATELKGEIVDTKCYFGVMNPGNGKVHRDCAARCLSGGVPPALLVRDASGRAMTVLLANWRRELLDHVAEPVTIRGRLARSAGKLVLYAE